MDVSFYPSYKDKVKDYNFGSLIRADARDEYGETNTIFGEPQSLERILFTLTFSSLFFSHANTGNVSLL